jgi:hypothetical protein
MLYLRENTTKYKQDMLGYFAKSNLNTKDVQVYHAIVISLEIQKIYACLIY